MSAEAGTPFYLEPDFHVAFHPQDSRCPSGNPYDIAQLSPLFFFFCYSKKKFEGDSERRYNCKWKEEEDRKGEGSCEEGPYQ